MSHQILATNTRNLPHGATLSKRVTMRAYVCTTVFATLCCGNAFASDELSQSTLSVSPERATGETSMSGPPDSGVETGLQEIVVSARKVTERIQDVPMSITALSAATLEQSGAMNLADIGREVPGLSVVSVSPGQNQLILRGLSSSAGNATVGYYIDDTPLSTPTTNLYQTNNMDPALFDLDRVEVLRGPQGTLYGAGSMGGTVRYITNQPNLTTFSGTVRALLSGTEGGGLNTEYDALVNAPVVPGTAAVRALGFYRDYDGYIDRYPTDPNNYLAVLSGPVEHNVNTEKTYGARVLLEIKPFDALTITPSIFFQRMHLGAPFTFDEPPGTLDHPIQSRLTDEPYNDQTVLYSLTINGDVAGVHITSSTSYSARRVEFQEDDSKVNYYFFSPNPQTYVYPTPLQDVNSTHNFAEELRATATVGHLHWLLGLFDTHVSALGVFNWPIPDGYNIAFGTPFGNQQFFDSTISLVDRQEAAFSELTYDITPALQTTVGARYFHQTQEQGAYLAGAYNGGASASNGSSSASGVTPKYGLTYHLTKDDLAYFTASKGFREGGPIYPLPGVCASDLQKLGLTSAPSSFKPDSIWSYELGAKTEWLDRRVTVNADVYYIDWTNVQQLVLLESCGYVFTANEGTASSKGAELEIQYAPWPVLHLSLGGAFNEAQLTSTVTGGQGKSGDTLENAPKWSATASAEYHRSFGAKTSGFARIDLSSTSHQFNNFDKESIYRNQPGYSTANFRLGVDRSIWRYSFFVTNLFDKHAEVALPLSYAADLTTTRRIALNRPRTIGVDVRVDF